ncbi:hypothetical protein DTO271D3_6291 [Paecilomyces variotii]|nr:hypothetical protein DTO271D3_6291 [Paecilomyces variotii]
MPTEARSWPEGSGLGAYYDPARRRPNTDSVSGWSKHRRRGPLALSQQGEERGRAVLVGYQTVDFYGIASTTE